MKAVLPKQCEFCRSQLIVEKREEVKEKIVDGRTMIEVVCPACGTTNEVLRKFKTEYKKITLDKY